MLTDKVDYWSILLLCNKYIQQINVSRSLGSATKEIGIGDMLITFSFRQFDT